MKKSIKISIILVILAIGIYVIQNTIGFPPSDMSGSIIQVHENSPYLVEKEDRLITFDGKKVKIKKDVT